VTLVAVSKTKPLDLIQQAYDAGQRDFGENYVQELVDKASQLPRDIRWHFIGTFQSNKAKLLASIPNLYALHTIASVKHAKTLNAHWTHSEPCRVYVQVHTSDEETKSGCAPSEVVEVASYIWSECPKLSLAGLMTIGAPGQSEDNPDFGLLRTCRDHVATHLHIPPETLGLSMGMSDDYLTAIHQGSTCIRIGSRLFGTRTSI
jgi:hypothetical protein